MPRYPDHIRELVAKYDLKPDDLWQVQSTWVIKHKAVERIGAQLGVNWSPPQIIEGSTADRTVVVLVSGTVGDRSEWSFGECSPENYRVSGRQQAYPWAMAEKRGKDRVVLKFLAIYGDVYSEDESEDFKAQTPNLSVAPLDEYEAPGEPDPFPGDPGPRKSAHSLRKDQPERWSEIVTALRSCVNVEDMRDYAEAVRDETSKWPDGWLKELRAVYRDHADSLTARAA